MILSDLCSRPFRRLARSLAGALTALGLALGAAVADTPPPLRGANNAGFARALALWLDDDEAAALPALAGLAASGNGAARLLLGQIDKTPALQGPYLAHMPRAERIALLRQPGGLSGQSWLNAEAGTPLADALLALRHPRSGPELIEAFEALDEERAAREALVALAAREHPGLSALDPSAVSPDLLYLLWRGADPARREAITALVPAGNPEWQMMGRVLDARTVDRWLAASPAAEPLAALCRVVCPDEIPPCLSAAYGALASHDALLTLGTPAAALVAQAEFLASARGRATTMRRILLAHSIRARRAMLERVAGQSQCLGEALVAETERYRRILPNGNGG